MKFVALLKDSLSLDIPSFLAAIKLIFTTTLASDRGLRDCIVPPLFENMRELRDTKEFVELVKSGLGDGDFAMEFIDAWSGLPGCDMRCVNCEYTWYGQRYHCPSCGGTGVEANGYEWIGCVRSRSMSI